jgi:hypothetical protein
MERRTGSDPEQDLERAGDELEERIDELDDRIDDARQEAKARHEDTDDGDLDEGDEEGSAGGDPTSFDDPESIDEDEDE